MRLVRPMLLLGMLLSVTSQAQEPVAGDEAVHPLLNARLLISGGGFWPEKEFLLSANGSVPGEPIDFDEAFLFDDSDATGMGGLLWRFGKRWSLGVEAWSLNTAGGAVLNEDYTWEDLTFLKGTFATAGVDLSVARIFFGRRMWSSARSETGIGLGVHWLELEAYIEGRVRTTDGDTDRQRGAADAEFPMPNIGFWHLRSLTDHWALSVRVDWLDVTFEEYRGNLWNAQLGLHYQINRRLGVALQGAYFELDGRIRESDWRGQAELKQYGPRASLYVTF